MAESRGGSWYRQRAAERDARAGHRRRIRGDRHFRKLLSRMPESFRDEVVEMLEVTGEQILAAQRAHTLSTRIRAALSKRVSRRTLRLRVGLIGRPINRRLFFARIIEVGRRAQTVNVTRRMLRGGRSYLMRVRARAADPFVRTARTVEIRDTMGGRLRTFWDRALARASVGASDD